MAKVTIIDRASGSWSEKEREAAVQAFGEAETWVKKPHRIVVSEKHQRSEFENALGHGNFTLKIVEYLDRWQ